MKRVRRGSKRKRPPPHKDHRPGYYERYFPKAAKAQQKQKLGHDNIRDAQWATG